MAPTLFFSYSHVDEALRNQLEVHLSALKRQGLIATWHDRRITAGSQVGDRIDANLNASQVVLLLVSSDFIASDYCYEREMARAMERHEKGDARIIPVILRPCDWHDLPLANCWPPRAMESRLRHGQTSMKRFSMLSVRSRLL